MHLAWVLNSHLSDNPELYQIMQSGLLTVTYAFSHSYCILPDASSEIKPSVLNFVTFWPINMRES